MKLLLLLLRMKQLNLHVFFGKTHANIFKISSFLWKWVKNQIRQCKRNNNICLFPLLKITAKKWPNAPRAYVRTSHKCVWKWIQLASCFYIRFHLSDDYWSWFLSFGCFQSISLNVRACSFTDSRLRNIIYIHMQNVLSLNHFNWFYVVHCAFFSAVTGCS